MDFYSTAVANFFCWNKAYALFPLPTHRHRKNYLLKPLNDDYRELIAEESCRQVLRIQDSLWDEDDVTKHPIRQQRRVGDRFTWTIHFSTHNISCNPKTPDFVLEHSHFSLYLPDANRQPTVNYFSICANALRSQTLRYQYTHGTHLRVPHADRGLHWSNFIYRRTGGQTRLQLELIKLQDRPLNYEELIASSNLMDDDILITWNKPDSWTYWDNDLPEWYRVWERLLRPKEGRPTELREGRANRDFPTQMDPLSGLQRYY